MVPRASSSVQTAVCMLEMSSDSRSIIQMCFLKFHKCGAVKGHKLTPGLFNLTFFSI